MQQKQSIKESMIW